MTDEEKAYAILEVTGSICDNQSADMAGTLLMALFILHLDTKTKSATTEGLIEIVTQGIRELDAAKIPIN